MQPKSFSTQPFSKIFTNRRKEEEINFGNKRIKFEIDPFKKKCLLDGLDDIALSLEKSEKISSYEKELKKSKPWIN